MRQLVRTLRADFRDEFVNARSYRSTDDQIGRDFDRAENYLSLVGLIIVILGGIAVSSVTRVFVLQKIRSIAVLKCLGARTRQIIAVYVLQVWRSASRAACSASRWRASRSAAIPLALRSSTASTSLLAEVALRRRRGARPRRGSAIGVLVSLLFSIVPLLHVRLVKPSLLLRDEAAPSRGVDWTRIGAVDRRVAGAGRRRGLAGRVARGRRRASALGFAALAVVLHLAGPGSGDGWSSPLAHSRSFPLRHAVLHLSRPGNQTRVILLAVGLGAFFIVGVRSLQASLLDEFSVQVGGRFAGHVPARHPARPGRRRARVPRRPRERRRARLQLIPVLRARVVAVDGQRDAGSTDVEDVRQRRLGLRASSRSPIAITSSRTSGDRRRVLERAVGGAGSVGREGHRTSGSRSTSATRCASTFSAARSTRGSRASATSTGAIRATAASCSCSARASSTARRRRSSRRSRDRRDPPARARFQHDLVEQFPNVSVIDFHESSRRPRRHVEGHAGDHGRRRASCCSAAA